MSEAAIAAILMGLAKETPALVISIVKALSRGGSDEDWAAEETKWRGKKYSDYDPNPVTADGMPRVIINGGATPTPIP